MDIFNTKIALDKLSKDFIELKDSPGLFPARSLISEILKSFVDKDGNFLEQFQTTAFYPRLWELFLNELFKELELKDISDQNRPDFHLTKGDLDFFIEASCSNPAENDEYNDEFIEKAIEQKDAITEKNLIDYYSIKIGSVLYSKLQKKYWNLDWVKEKPIILAIKPSHNKLANFFPDYKIIEYLYGEEVKTIEDKEGKPQIVQREIAHHTHKDKTIPSGFFNQPDAENISAVIFSNTCDLHKFNRMGYEGNYKIPKIIMCRSGLKVNHKDRSTPSIFDYQVGNNEPKEKWGEGISIFHNPKAKYPIDRSIFSSIRQLWINEKGQYDGTTPEFFPFTSITGVVYCS